MIDRDPGLTSNQLSERTPQAFGIHLSKSTIRNYLNGKLITLRKEHAIPATMNSDANKELWRQYAARISEYMSEGKMIVWMDKTNINLFGGRSHGCARVGDRAVVN